MYNFNHLFYFYIVAKKGSLIAAAKHLNISQPALCHQVKLLEAELNLQLFRKLGRSNVLTVSGQSVFSYCDRMFETSEEMRTHFKDSIFKKNEKIKIFHTSEISQHLVLDIIFSQFSTVAPQDNSSMEITEVSEIELSLLANFSDVDIAFSLAKIAPQNSNRSVEICTEVRYLSGSQSKEEHALLIKSMVQKIPYFSKCTLVVTRDDSELRIQTESYLKANYLHFERRLVVQSVTAMQNAIQYGLGC